jgi:hypothetical protein
VAVNSGLPPSGVCRLPPDADNPESGRDPWQPTASKCELLLDQIDQLNLGVSQIEYYPQSAELGVDT